MKSKWIILFLLIIILFLLFGPPTSIGIPSGLVWSLDNKDPLNNSIEQTPPIYANDAIKILNLKSRRENYFVGEDMTIDFKVDNPFSMRYNLSTYWIYNNTPFEGWKTSGNLSDVWYSSYPAIYSGEWEANIIVKWEYKNETFDIGKNLVIEAY